MKKVAVYGTGLIGSAWGVDFLRNGCDVVFYDLDDEKLAAARQSLLEYFGFLVQVKVLTDEAVQECMARASFTMDIETAVKDTVFIQENGPERIAIKQSIIKDIEQYCPADAIIGSSTSGLLISDIAAYAKHPERIVGGHPYNPVYLIPLVELSKGVKTSQEAVDAAVAFYKSVGKEPIVLQKECPGFISNRIQMAINREAYDLVYRGVCSVEDVDRAVTFGPGLRWAIMGPHLVNQLTGGKGGFRFASEVFAPVTQVWLEDMARWTKAPEEYTEMAIQGIAEEMANRAPGTGQTDEELIEYRNKGLVELLRFHGKL